MRFLSQLLLFGLSFAALLFVATGRSPIPLPALPALPALLPVVLTPTIVVRSQPVHPVAERATKAASGAEKARRRAKTAALASAYGPNYAGGAQLRALRRWKRLPVHVYFALGGAWSAERQKLAIDGFSEWTKATDGVLRFSVVSSPKAADVTVRFLSGAYVPPAANTLGRTEFLTWDGILFKAEMALATGGVRPAELTETAAHEWGHALGIDGHSDDLRDLMYSVSVRYISPDPDFVPPVAVRTITTRDLNTVKAAYAPLFPRP